MNDEPQRSCAVCGASLNKGARYCVACGRYQSPLRRFFESINVQSLVALIPIATLAFVFVKDRVVEHGSEVKASVSECTRQRIRVVASNAGDRNAVLKSATVGISVDGAKPAQFYPLSPGDPGGNRSGVELQPQKVAFIDLFTVNQRNERFELPVPSTGASCTYQVRLELIAFDHAPLPVEANCPCAG